MDFFEGIEFWYWWVAAVVFVVIEVFAPGAVFVWLGAAAAAVGLVLLAVPDLSWELQLLTFALLAVFSAFGWRAYRKRNPPPESDHPTLNRRGEQYIGRNFTLNEAIENGLGRLKVDDTIWKIEGADLAPGTKVRVTGVEGTVLIVKPLDDTSE